MNRSTNSTISGNPTKVRSRLSLIMLLVFMMTLFAGVIVTSGCGKEEEKTTIKEHLETTEGKLKMNTSILEVIASPSFTDVKWSTPSDNSLVYEYYYAPGNVDVDLLNNMLDTSTKAAFQSAIKEDIANGFAEYSITVKYFDNDGNFLTERTYTKDN